jgi:hypothetical protein
VSDARTQEIAAEQQVVDRIYERLDGMRERANALAGEGHRRAAGGSVTGLVERDAMVHRAATQLRALDSEEDGLVFGRLDFDDGETYHIGRLGVREDREPLLIDWRAPAAAPFYRATTGQPLGVVRRRVIICHGSKVVDLDDDVLSPDAAGDLRVLGEGALLAALRRSRGRHMRDIVTTIQREQDEAIRAPAKGVTLITGGPGTGKTQVALHRAAYLLYTDRGRFSDGRILVVGPSTVFTDYIGRVLPSLGEDSVHLRAIGELVEGVTATRRDRADVAEIKGSDRMRDVLVELMWQAPPAAPDRLRLVYAGQVLTVGAGDLAAARRRVRARCETAGTQPNAARPVAATVLLDALWAKVDGAHLKRETFGDDVGDRTEFDRFLQAWWPALTPTGVLSWLTDAARVVGLDAGSAELLAASYRARPDWSVDDVPLLDELTQLLGEPPKAPKAPTPEWQLRELTSGTRTVETFVLSCGLREGWELYDPGHATHPLAAGTWQQLLGRLGRREVRTLELNTGYRVPQRIAQYAARVLAPGIAPTRSYRAGGTLRVRPVDDLHAAVRDAVRQAPRDATVAVIAADDAADELVPLVDGPDVAVIPASSVKGLEFDHVIVVEPADIVAAEPRGLNRLYVALTRAVGGLVVVHRQALPAALRDHAPRRGRPAVRQVPKS